MYFRNVEGKQSVPFTRVHILSSYLATSGNVWLSEPKDVKAGFFRRDYLEALFLLTNFVGVLRCFKLYDLEEQSILGILLSQSFIGV